MDKEKALALLKEKKLLPLVTIKDINDVPFLAEALLTSGLQIVEIAYRSNLASEAIRQLCKIDGLIVGAGTITTLHDAKEALACGAHFLVTPGINVDVLQYAIQENVLICPGVVTPTDIITVKNLGIKTLKFFPAGIFGGVKGLKALHGPFKDCDFVPTGGIDASNYKEYLELPYVAAVGGSFVLPESYIRNHDLDGLCSHIKSL